MMPFANFLGGLALFLFAMKFMSDNLNAVAGNELKKTLKKLTDRPYKGVFVGLIATAITQSSTATQLMTMGLVNSKIMTLLSAIGVNMGADIGTTLTGQMIAFKISEFSYLFILVGVIFLFIKHSKAMEKWAMIILSFGLLFVGLSFMSQSVGHLRESSLFGDIIIYISHNPILTILTGVLVTMIINSSTACIGIVMALAVNGLVTPITAMYIVFGANIGTNTTGLIASLSLSRSAKRVATFCMMYNIMGVSLFSTLTYLGFFDKFICYITTGSIHFPAVISEFNQTGVLDPKYIGQQDLYLPMFNITRFIANAHTFFNVAWCLTILPFATLLEKLVSWLIPEGREEALSSGDPRHLDRNFLHSGALAVEQSIKEMGEMLKLVKYSLEVSMDAFITKNYRKSEKVEKIEQAIDQLQKEVTHYLVDINEHSRMDEVNRKIPALLHTVNDIEKLGDFAEQINKILNMQILSQKTPFFHEFILLIPNYHNNIMYMIDLTLRYLESFENKLSYQIIEVEGRINQQHADLRKKILTMIQTAQCDAESGLNAIDYIDTIEIFADKIKNIVIAGSYNFTYQQSERKKYIFDTDEV
jgi:phosphate:Na+ symporter